MALSPVSYQFIAAGAARQARVSLAWLRPARVNVDPSREGHGGAPATVELAVPITDRSYWEGRHALTELALRKEDGETLVINDAVVSVTREKRVVRTALVGLDGTIKEYVSNGDHEVSIAIGIVAVDAGGRITDEYPEEGIREVKKFLDENRAIEASSVFLSIFGIERLVVTRFSLVQSTGSNRQTIEVRALSDEDYVIKSTGY
ncbi:MAG: DUF6046 domain-containing protein [Odoribacteraceae bacterium]|jgi:hypothetical protein|nr:DUF6046 domain-containing protein [Odoribacteraceae bacterium]